jgi:hypothetical protein
LGLKPGKSFYLEQVKFTKQLTMARVNIAFYWRKITKGKTKNEGWYLINNLSNLSQTIKAYKKRMGIEVRNALPLSSLNAFKLGRQLCSKIVNQEDII